jgi:hypothetical protein
MSGGMRWPFRPCQVHCVLVAVWLIAAFSLQSGFTGSAGRSPDGLDLTYFVGRLNVRAIAIGPCNSNCTDLKNGNDVAVASAGRGLFPRPADDRTKSRANTHDVRFVARSQSAS